MQFKTLYAFSFVITYIVATPIPTPKAGLHGSMVDVPTYRVRAVATASVEKTRVGGENVTTLL